MLAHTPHTYHIHTPYTYTPNTLYTHTIHIAYTHTHTHTHKPHTIRTHTPWTDKHERSWYGLSAFMATLFSYLISINPQNDVDRHWFYFLQEEPKLSQSDFLKRTQPVPATTWEDDAKLGSSQRQTSASAEGSAGRGESPCQGQVLEAAASRCCCLS